MNLGTGNPVFHLPSVKSVLKSRDDDIKNNTARSHDDEERFTNLHLCNGGGYRSNSTESDVRDDVNYIRIPRLKTDGNDSI